MKKNRVIIIGAGLGGLAVGIRLAAEGYQVRIMEKNAQPGGWLCPSLLNGFTFPNSTSIITLPQHLFALFQSVGRDPKDYLTLRPVDPVFRFFTADNRSFSFYRQPADTTMKNRNITLKDQQALHVYGTRSDAIFKRVNKRFVAEPLKVPRFPFQRSFGFRRWNPTRSAARSADRLFESDLLKQAFSVWPVFAGGAPSLTSNFYRMIPAAIHSDGAFLPEGGPEALINALVRLFRECGGDLVTHAEVQSIQVYNGKEVSGVRLTDGSIHHSDYVIADADAGSVYRDLIDSDRYTYAGVRETAKKESSCGLFIYNMGFRSVLTGTEEPETFNILLPEDEEQWEKDVFTYGRLPKSPFIFLSVPGKMEAGFVPENQYSLTAALPVPNLKSDIVWERESYGFRSIILDRLQSLFRENLREQLICESFSTPEDTQRQFNTLFGSAWSFSPSQKGNILPRIANRRSDVRNLYFVGSGAHPGPFIPAILQGAELVRKDICSS